MDSNPENRKKTRFEHTSKVTLENGDLGVQLEARMFNYSNLGLYFEADFLLQPDTEVRIGINNSPFGAKPKESESYHGIIKWRKKLKRSSYYYGYGVELVDENAEAIDEDQNSEIREHPRKACSIPVKYGTTKQFYEGITKNVSRGGLYIMTEMPVAVGQQIKVEIPINKKGKIARLNGKVIWSNQQGFGAKFQPSEK
ncbi:MAG: PilZ domain-containing protein [Desulfobacterales bacterium]|nr:PilZ domain-containing protein [Desulfobacterales bacterium]